MVRCTHLESLRSFINLKKDADWLLIAVSLVAALIPNIPHVILLIYGPQGSAKSFLLKLLGRLIDPSLTPTLSPPKDLKEAVQLFAHRWFVPLDNLQTVENWLSDLICRAVTGEGFSKRGLFTDEEDVIFTFRRVIAINGIHPSLNKPDALDRAIPIELERIESDNRRTEEDIFKRLEPILPKILGAIFTALSKAIGQYGDVKLKQLPRMADFTKWGCAIAEPLGFTQDKFLNAYWKSINSQHEEVVHGNPVPSAVVEFMDDKQEWEGSPTELYGELVKIAEKQKVDLKEKGWPKSAAAMTSKLKEFHHNLREVGILVNFSKSGPRTTTFRKVEKNSVHLVQVVQTPETIEDSDGRSMDDLSSPLKVVHNIDYENAPSLLAMDDLDEVDDTFATLAREAPEGPKI